jgi:penicillin-binding protein 2
VRGKILDRNGAPLASSRRAFNIYVVPRRFTPEVRTRLIDLLALSEAEVARMDSRAAHMVERQAGRAILVLGDQGRRRARLVARARLELGGAVEVHSDPYRDYPRGELASHLIGYMSEPSPRERAERARQGQDASELVGRYGLEEVFERSLRGKQGVERFIAGGEGARVAAAKAEALIEEPLIEPPAAGHDVVLTLDLELQRIAERAVRSYAAAAVVVAEVETGRILALVSTPSFDPNAMTGDLAAAEHERLKSDRRLPYLDRTLEQDYPPASTFKLVTAVAGLESGMASPDEQLTCTGKRVVGDRVLRDMGVHGTIDFLEALQHSCNVYFWTIGERVGIDRLAEVARDFGFGAPTGLGINGDVSGQLPDRALRGPQTDDSNLVLTLNAAIGSGEVKVTVIQLAMAYAALANGGRLYAPQVVRRVQTAAGQVVEEREPILRRRVAASPTTLELIRKGMWRAVNARGGTAFAARKGAVELAGKTGTSESLSPPEAEGSGQPGWNTSIAHGWFAGWAPSDRPQIVIVVLLEHGGVGGTVAGPVARAIVDGYFTRVLPPLRRADKQVSR